MTAAQRCRDAVNMLNDLSIFGAGCDARGNLRLLGRGMNHPRRIQLQRWETDTVAQISRNMNEPEPAWSC